MARIMGNKRNDVLNGTNTADKVYGGGGDDQIWGHGGNDQIYGEAGNDTIYGGAGGDLIFGGDGNDTIYAGTMIDDVGDGLNYHLNGGAGNDAIYGDSDGDELSGRMGADFLRGGPGADTFLYHTSFADSQEGVGVDTIDDYEPGTDTILFFLADANASVPGYQTWSYAGSEAPADHLDSANGQFTIGINPAGQTVLRLYNNDMDAAGNLQADFTLIFNGPTDSFALGDIQITGSDNQLVQWQALDYWI